MSDLDDGTRELITRLYPSLRAFAASVGTDDMEPDDLVQEALVRTLRLHHLNDLEQPLAYLRRTILSVASSNKRRLFSSKRAIARLAAEAETDQNPSYPSDVSHLLALRPKWRALLWLVEVDGMSYAEAGAIVGCSAAAARAQAARARKAALAAMSREATAHGSSGPTRRTAL